MKYGMDNSSKLKEDGSFKFYGSVEGAALLSVIVNSTPVLCREQEDESHGG